MYNEFLAEIYFYTEAEGGRKSNIPKALKYYRPLLYYKMDNYHCQIELDNIDLITTGNTYK